MSSILQIRDDTLEDTMMDFLKVIYEMLKNKIHFTANISTYTGHTHFVEVL